MDVECIERFRSEIDRERLRLKSTSAYVTIAEFDADPFLQCSRPDCGLCRLGDGQREAAWGKPGGFQGSCCEPLPRWRSFSPQSGQPTASFLAYCNIDSPTTMQEQNAANRQQDEAVGLNGFPCLQYHTTVNGLNPANLLIAFGVRTSCIVQDYTTNRQYLTLCF